METDSRNLAFNYATGWGSSPKPPLYLEAMKMSRELNKISQMAAKNAWELEHALWVVRIATTGEEKAVALRHLEETMGKYRLEDAAA